MGKVLAKIIIDTEKTPFASVLSVGGKVYTFLNPVSYLDAIKNKQLFLQFDGIFADGSLLVTAIRLLYGKKVTRRSFDMTSLAPQLLEYAENTGKTVYIVASKQEQVEAAIAIFRNRYSRINIVGYRNGYFSDEQAQLDEARHIVEVAPDFLIVGMGAVMQESFLLKVKNAGFKGIGFTCGGFIHQTSKNQIDYYPRWVDDYNVRFLYRIYREPHTRIRYLMAGLIFPVRFVWEKFHSKDRS